MTVEEALGLEAKVSILSQPEGRELHDAKVALWHALFVSILSQPEGRELLTSPPYSV